MRQLYLDEKNKEKKRPMSQETKDMNRQFQEKTSKHL